MSLRVVTILASIPGLLLEPTARLDAGDPQRFVVGLADGSTVRGNELQSWSSATRTPRLDDRALFDPANPAVWILDTALQPASPPAACVELVGGDSLPGRVTGFRRGDESAFEQLFPHVLVEPACPLDPVEGPRLRAVRVSVRSLERVIWERRGADVYTPGTVYLRDRRVRTFRSLRWSETAVKLLVLEAGAPTTVELPFAEIAELHLPRAEAWSSFAATLALLSPDGSASLLQAETDDGLRVTASTERFLPRSEGGEADPRHWLHGYAPAWSPDVLWVRHRSIRLRRILPPGQVALTFLDPAVEESGGLFGGSWKPRRDRNVHGGVLRNGGREAGWGFGVQARTRLEWRLPPLPGAVRVTAALDDLAGRGGCARAIVEVLCGDPGAASLNTGQRGELLVGASPAPKVDWIAWGEANQQLGGAITLSLLADDAHEETPVGADPFDIRDLVNWVEPVLRYDPRVLETERRLRMAQVVPAWQSWDMDCAEGAPVRLRNRSTENGGRWWVDVVPALPFFRLSRRLRLAPEARWLCLSLLREIDRQSQARIEVVANGARLGIFEVPMRFEWSQTEPILVPLDGLPRGEEVRFDLLQTGEGSRSGVEWAGIGVIDAPPGVVRLDVKPGQPGDSPTEGVPPLELPIREQPRFGELRYLSFEWRASSDEECVIVLGHDGRWGPELERRGKSFQYVAGPGGAQATEGIRLGDTPPREWTRVVRDLHADFGAFSLTGLELHSRGGSPIERRNVFLTRNARDVEALQGAGGADSGQPVK